MNGAGYALPESFLRNMQELLGDEFCQFIDSYSKPSRRGLRLNRLKADANSIDLGIPLTPVPWCKEGFEYPTTARPGKSLLYGAGLFYIQEPSAMCPAAVLRPKPGEKVLDICAAPGGKSVQLAGYLRGQGVLVSNDASPSRSRALVKNLEMAGVTNAIVLTEMPYRLATRFLEYFDTILVDAPCSGEGMFRRDPDAARAYTANKPEACVALQKEILHHAAKMLKPGGRMVYSTCTFNPLENEGVISSFLQARPEFELLPIDHEGLGISPGRSEWATVGVANLNSTARIWPHLAPGEGHYVAKVRKQRAEEGRSQRLKATDNSSGKVYRNRKVDKAFTAFCEEMLKGIDFLGPIIRHGNSIYMQPEEIDLKGLRVARSGWLLGECAKDRFIPSQALAMGITKNQARYTIELAEPDVTRYLKGESLTPPEDYSAPGKPWVLICYKGHPLGWARLVQGRLKNQLPNGWIMP